MVKCNYCNKEYASYQSRSNHVKKFHLTENNNDKPNDKHITLNDKPNNKHITLNDKPNDKHKKIYECKKCNKSYNHYQSRWRHETKCNEINKLEKIKNIDELEKIKNENEHLKNQNNIIKEQLIEVQKLLVKSSNIRPRTLNKINNLMNNSNNTYNNIQIIKLGDENLYDVLTEKQKLSILNRCYGSLNAIVELVHVSPQEKFKQFKNVYISNIHNNYAYVYHPATGNHALIEKDKMLEELVDVRMYDIQQFYNDYKDTMNESKKECLELFIKRMEDQNDCIKNNKKDEIKLLLFNNNNTIQSIIDGITNNNNNNTIDTIINRINNKNTKIEI